MIVITTDPVLGPGGVALVNENNPRIGWHNIVTVDTVAATSESADEPATNLANPATFLYWRSLSTSTQYVTVSLGTAQDVNYFAVARHNFGSTGAVVTLQGSEDSSSWTDLASPVSPSSDNVLMLEFNTVFYRYYRLRIVPGTEPPRVAVLYIGVTLVMQRRVYVGHTPITLARKVTVANSMSENGSFLGRTFKRLTYETSVDFQNLSPLWYRTEFDPFVEASKTVPFFWAWRPGSYPDEVGYAWLTSDVAPSNQRPNGMMQVSMQMQGIR